MSGPSFSNIDRWLFELVEGNLSQEQIAQLKAFLLNHPELDIDVDTWNLARVSKETIIYPHQKQLERKRPVGLYMSLGFASIAIFLALGVYTNLSPVSDQNQNLVSDSTTETENHSNSNSDQPDFYLSNSSTPEEKIGIPNTAQIENRNDNDDYQLNFVGNPPTFNSVNVDLNNNQNEIQSVSQTESQLIVSNSQPVLQTFETKEIKSNSKYREIQYRSTHKPHGIKFQSSNYHLSFASRVAKWGRSVQRMMDNPLALRNSRDPYYHIPGMQATDINAGAVGTLVATRIQSVSRAQWLGESNQQIMNQLSVDGYSYGMRGGIGFQLNHNFYGTGAIENYHSTLTYSPKISVTKHVMVEPSIRFKMGNKKLDDEQMSGTHLEYDRMNSQSYYIDGSPPVVRSLWYKDLGLGIMVNTKWFFAGIQEDNILQHEDINFNYNQAIAFRSNKHFIATIGTDYQTKKENLGVSPYLVYQRKGNFSEAWLGANAHYNWLTFGGAISSNLEPSVSLGMKLDHFMITYNADMVNSEMLQKSSLSHQITIRFLSKPGRVGQRLLNQ